MTFSLHKFVRRVQKDINGDIISKGKYTNLSCFLFGFRLFKKKHRRSRKVGLDFGPVNRFSVRKRVTKGAKILLRRRRLCVFYGNLSLKDLKYFSNEAHDLSGNINNNFANLLESRLEVLTYRLHFSSSILQARQQIKSGYFLINKEIVRDPDYVVVPGDVIDVLESYKLYIGNIICNLVYKWLWCGVPRYVEVDYRILSACYLDFPILEQIAYPFYNTLKNNMYFCADYRTKLTIKLKRRFIMRRGVRRWLRYKRKRFCWWFKFKRQRLLPIGSFINRKF